MDSESHLQIIKEATAALSESADDLEATISAVLRLLRKYAGMKRGTVSLIDTRTGSISNEVSEGNNKTRPSEKAIRMVVRTGKAVAIPNDGFMLLCVPIKQKGKTVGLLSVDVPSQPTTFEREQRLLEIVSSILAHAVHTYRALEVEKQKLRDENRQMKAEMRERFHVHNMVGNNKRILEVYEQVLQVADSDATVLITGESGTGKELVASAIHYHSPRAQGPLVKINCGALPESLIESELFGHEKGAFTGAIETKPGKFELANGGTLFLDEVSELSALAQTKLLRAVQEREIERVGGKKTLKVNVRIIAATNKELGELARTGQFRLDLYYRLNVFPVFMPALRERRSDIPLLTDYFLEKFAKRDSKPIRRIATSAIDMLMAYHWPGNVRELENCLERAVLVCKGGVIQAHHLPPTLQTAEATATGFKGTLRSAVESYERDLVTDALKSARGNLSKAARLLGSTQRIIAYKVRAYEIDPESYSTKMS